MKHLTLILLLSLLSGCATAPIPYTTSKGKNDCLVQSVGFKDAYNSDVRLSKYRWAEVICVVWDKEIKGHAICVYEYNKRIMVYDNEKGSWTITKDMSLKNDAFKLAQLWSPASGISQAFFMYEIKD